MPGTLAPAPWFTGLDNAGVTLAGAKLFTYASGTSTKLATYQDAAQTTPHANPIILDAAGRAVIYLANAAYKFVLAPSNDNDPPLAPIKTVDPVNAIPETNVDTDIVGTLGDAIPITTSPFVVFMSDGSGGLTAGRWYRMDADFAERSIGARVIGGVGSGGGGGAGEVVSIRIAGRLTDYVGLTPGARYYASTSSGGVQSSAPANARLVGVADSTTSLVLAEKEELDIRRVASFTTVTGNVGAGEDTLATYTCGVGGLYEDGMSWEGRFWGFTANNANAKQLRLRMLDGTNNQLVTDIPLTAGETGYWDLTFQIIRITNTAFSSVSTTTVGPASGPSSRLGTNILSVNAILFANAIELRLTGEATADNDIRVVGGIIKRGGVGL